MLLRRVVWRSKAWNRNNQWFYALQKLVELEKFFIEWCRFLIVLGCFLTEAFEQKFQQKMDTSDKKHQLIVILASLNVV